MNFQNFHFVRPWWLLGLIPMGWLLWRCSHLSHPGRSWQQICDPHLLPHLLIGREQDGRRGPWIFLGVGWTIALMALAGPVWSKLPQPVVRSQAALVVVLDLSRSMDAQDVRPSRLTRAKHKVLDLLKRRTEGQTALVVFAGEPFVVSPLTDDGKTIASMVPTLSTALMPVQGSQPEQGLELADQLLEQSAIGKGEILLLTDDGEGSPVRKTVEHLRQKGRVVSIMAVGTPEGAPIPVQPSGFLKDASGGIVIAKLDVEALRALAESGGGQFVTLQTDDRDLDQLLISQSSRFPFKETVGADRTTERWREEGPWLVFAVLLVAFPAFRKGWVGAVLFLVFLVPMPASAWSWDDMWSRPDQQGARKLASGHPKEAAELFANESWRGVAQYQSGQYEQAAESFAHQTGPDGRYNQGNALARLGRFEEALSAYEQVLQEQPDHADARHNADLIRKLLEQQQQQQQAQNSSGQDHQGSQDPQSSSPGSEGEDGQEPPSESSPEVAEPTSAEQGQAEQSAQGADLSTEEKQSREGRTDSAKDQKSQELAHDDQSPPQNSVPRPRDPKSELPEHEQAQMVQGLPASKEDQEERQALEQWLRRIPDDPGGLLRRKFMLEHQRRGKVNQGVGQSW